MNTCLNRFRSGYAVEILLFRIAAAEEGADGRLVVAKLVAHGAEHLRGCAAEGCAEQDNAADALGVLEELLCTVAGELAVEERNFPVFILAFGNEGFAAADQFRGALKFQNGGRFHQRAFQTADGVQVADAGNRFNPADACCNRAFRKDLERICPPGVFFIRLTRITPVEVVRIPLSETCPPLSV